MGACVDNFSTSKFTLRSQEAADHIKNLVEMLKDEESSLFSEKLPMNTIYFK